MDLIYRKTKYKEYLKKLQLINDQDQDLSEDDHSDLIRNNINEILEDLRDKSDQHDHKISYSILLIPLVVVLSYYSYLNGLGLSFLYLVMLVLFFLYSNGSMKSVIRLNKELKWTKDDAEQSEKSFLSRKITYVESAIGIKQNRIQLIAQFYTLFFAPFLYYTYQLVFSSFPFSTEFFGLIIAYIISIPFWHTLFSSEMGHFTTSRELLLRYQKESLQA